MYSYIDSTKLKRSEKYELGKVIRSKLNNYEQGILALNIISHLGREWETSGLLSKYKVIKNVPENFLTFDKHITIKQLFPSIDFEWEKARSTMSALHGYSIGDFRITIQRVKDE